ncbi:unnamed protein product, partial [Symbiodinium necroappetens]
EEVSLEPVDNSTLVNAGDMPTEATDPDPWSGQWNGQETWWGWQEWDWSTSSWSPSSSSWAWSGSSSTSSTTSLAPDGGLTDRETMLPNAGLYPNVSPFIPEEGDVSWMMQMSSELCYKNKAYHDNKLIALMTCSGSSTSATPRSLVRNHAGHLVGSPSAWRKECKALKVFWRCSPADYNRVVPLQPSELQPVADNLVNVVAIGGSHESAQAASSSSSEEGASNYARSDIAYDDNGNLVDVSPCSS